MSRIGDSISSARNATRRALGFAALSLLWSLAFSGSAHASGYINGQASNVDPDGGFNGLCVFAYREDSTPTSPPTGATNAAADGTYSMGFSQGGPLDDDTYRVMFDDCPVADNTFQRDQSEEESECGTQCGYRRVWYDGTPSGASSFAAAADVVVAGEDVNGIDVSLSQYGQEPEPQPEPGPPAACNDGIDNDGDGQIDFPVDAGCSSESDNDESGGNSTEVGDGEVDADVDVKKKQKGLKVKVKVACIKACTAKVKGKAKLKKKSGKKQRASASAKAKKVKLKGQSKEIQAGEATVLKLKPKGKKNKKQLKKALNKRKKFKVKVPLSVRIDEAEGDSILVKRVVKLKK